MKEIKEKKFPTLATYTISFCNKTHAQKLRSPLYIFRGSDVNLNKPIKLQGGGEHLKNRPVQTFRIRNQLAIIKKRNFLLSSPIDVFKLKVINKSIYTADS